MADDLESRLKSHARAFEGLMSLIPAKDYYGKDESVTSNQYKSMNKKQTKAEKRAAKMAKLDPASHQTAKDVMDENARKRKRELEAEGEPGSAASSDIDMDIEKEKPREGLKAPAIKAKKQKTDKDAADAEEAAREKDDKAKGKQEKIADKRRQKREQKKEKAAQKQQRDESKKALQEQFTATLGADAAPNEEDESEDDDEEVDTTGFEGEDGLQALDITGLEDESTSAETPTSGQSNSSSTSAASATSSISSIVPSSTDGTLAQKDNEEKSKAFKYDPAKQEDYRARLNAKLEQLRAARKADGPDGRPAKNRAELIEARRKKEAERKAAKKANRQLAKEDEERLKAEEQLARIRGASGSPSIFSVASTPEVEQNFNFGKVAWKDGQQLDGKLSGFLEQRKKKGKSDPKTALEAAKKKQARISGLDEAKRKEIEEKDLWLAAKKRAQGEKVLDDPKLLNKSVKRLEKEKAKSKQEWKDRLTNVQKGIQMKQKRREDNLRKRREEKGVKKGGKGKAKKKPGKKVAKRPGFEGTFKAR